MKNKLLLPPEFKKLGLWMLLLGLLGIWVATSEGLINVYRIIDPAKVWADGSYPYPANFWQVNQLFGYFSVGTIICGLLFFFFSKEKDEFFYKVRLESLQFASITQVSLTFCACIYAFFARSEAMERILPSLVTLSVVCFWILYFLRYSYIVYFKAKSGSEV
ncbi:hypothetical protein BH24BAC1_BH24BAC1_24610 [soil metagenome]